MVATTSAIFTVRTALYDLVREAAETGIQVVRVSDIVRDREGIFLGDSSVGNEEPTAFSGGTRSRRMETISHDIETWAVDVDPATCERRAVELAATVEDVLAEDPKLSGVPGLIAAQVTAWDMSVQMSDETEFICTVKMTITTEVRKA